MTGGGQDAALWMSPGRHGRHAVAEWYGGYGDGERVNYSGRYLWMRQVTDAAAG